MKVVEWTDLAREYSQTPKAIELRRLRKKLRYAKAKERRKTFRVIKKDKGPMMHLINGNPFEVKMCRNEQMDSHDVLLQVGGFETKADAERFAKAVAEWMTEHGGEYHRSNQ